MNALPNNHCGPGPTIRGLRSLESECVMHIFTVDILLATVIDEIPNASNVSKPIQTDFS